MATRVSLLALAMLAAFSLAVLHMNMMLSAVSKPEHLPPSAVQGPSAGSGSGVSTSSRTAVIKLGHGGRAEGGLVVKVDPYARALASGRRDATVYGFGIAALWRKESIPEAALLRQRYDAFAERVRAIPTARDTVYVYPFEAFHCTVAALVKFTAPALASKSAAVRRQHTDAWHAAISRAFSSPRFPRSPGKLIMGRPSLGNAAAVFRYDNPGGEVATIRRLIRDAIESDAELQAAGVEFDSGTLGIPEIVHSSFLRFTGRLSGISDDLSTDAAAEAQAEAQAARNFAREFDAVADSWEPLEITLSEVCFVIEDVPYMHGYGTMPDKIIQRYPLH